MLSWLVPRTSRESWAWVLRDMGPPTTQISTTNKAARTTARKVSNRRDRLGVKVHRQRGSVDLTDATQQSLQLLVLIVNNEPSRRLGNKESKHNNIIQPLCFVLTLHARNIPSVRSVSVAFQTCISIRRISSEFPHQVKYSSNISINIDFIIQISVKKL